MVLYYSYVCVCVCVCVRACARAHVWARVCMQYRCKSAFENFSHFAAVSLSGVASLADNFPSFPASGPFLPDVPGFHVPPASIFPPQLRSSSSALPLDLHFNNCSDVFSFISCFDMPEPFQPSPSRHNRYRFHLCFFQYLLISPVF